MPQENNGTLKMNACWPNTILKLVTPCIEAYRVNVQNDSNNVLLRLIQN